MSQSFDSMADLYDGTRTVDQDCLAAALDFVAGRFPPRDCPRVIEPGIGTGRIAIPLALRGYQVSGIDVSGAMLAKLASRLAELSPTPAVRAQPGDATTLPYEDGVFDLGVAVHLFYFIREWRNAADELLRVVRDDGAVVLMHTGTGAEVPFLNERYKALCAGLGHPIEAVGVRSTSEVAAYYAERGCEIETVRDRWCSTARIPLGTAVGYIGDRAYSFTAGTPDVVHAQAVARLRGDAEARFGTADATVEVPNQVYFVIVRRP